MTDGGPALDELSTERDRGLPRVRAGSAWIWRGLAVAVLVGLAGVLGPNLLAGHDDRDRPRPPEPTADSAPSGASTPTSRPLSALRWRVRGDLAEDTEFAAAALAAARKEEPAAEKVLYAAMLPDRSRLAIVAASDQEASALAFRGAGLQAFHVPSGAEPTEGRLSYAGRVATPDDLAGWAGHGRGGVVFAVLLGRPAPPDAQISSAIEYTKVGSATRSWQPVRSRDGSAIVALGIDSDPLVVARPTYGVDAYPVLMTVDGDLSAGARQAIAAEVTVDGLDGSYRGPAPLELRRAVVDGAWVLFDPRRSDIRVLWSGGLGGGQRGALLVLRRPDGPMFQLFVFRGKDGGTFAQGLRHVPWADAEVLPWVLQTGQLGTPLLLINPSGAGIALITPAERGKPRRLRIGADGVANLGDDQAVAARQLSGAVITVFAPSGRTRSSTTWSDQDVTDPFVIESS